MNKLIYKKFFNNITIFFILITVSLGLIVWIIQAVNYLDFVSEDGHSLKIYFYFTALSLPKIISRIFLYGFFISIFYSLIKFEENNELLVFWTHGVNKFEFTNKLLKYSLIILLVQMMFTTLLVPSSQNKARSYIRSSNIGYLPSVIKERKFIDNIKNVTIYVEKKNNQNLNNIFLKDQYNNNSFQIIYAKKGVLKIIEDKNYLILFDGKFIKNENGIINSFDFRRTEFNLSKYGTKTTTTPKIQEVNTLTLFNCINSFLKVSPINFNKFNNKNFDCFEDIHKDVIREFLKRIYLPIYIPLIALIASLIIGESKNALNYSKLKFLFFSLGTLIVILAEISIKFVATNTFQNIIFFTIPIILFSTTYYYTYKKYK
jgi:lipopolysaccharide export system permease protein|tara:strand:- start:825 stop:1946 length:1122 start_codon:yes stop_codon:yes gene_type:complete